jgi:hypothetical protein
VAAAAPGHLVVSAPVPGPVGGNGAVAAPSLVPGIAHADPATARRRAELRARGVVAQPSERQGSMTLLYVWIMLFGFVGTQLAWTLRPFFGSPGEKFEFFRSIDGNFYVDIVRTLSHLF